jgi:hypothetical protein
MFFGAVERREDTSLRDFRFEVAVAIDEVYKV